MSDVHIHTNTDEDEILQSSIRSTRKPLNKPIETTNPATLNPPSLKDLLYGEKFTSLDELLSMFPGRRIQIIELLRLIGPLNSPMLPVFIYGGVSTGKTSIVLQIFKHLNRPFVYSSCLSSYNPRILFENILNQLLLHRKNSSNGYSSVKRCEKPSDFVNYFRDGLVSVSDKLSGKDSGSMIYLIFDNLELVRNWDKSSTLLPFLFNLHCILNLPKVGIIFISNTQPDTYYSSMSYMEPLPVHFPDYTEDDLRQIFMRNQENPKLYGTFIDVALKPFFRVTKRLDELTGALMPLFKKYCEPFGDLGNVLNEDTKRRLFSLLQPHMFTSLNEIFKVPAHAVYKEGTKQKGCARKHGGCEGHDEMDFHMSISARYLLISAFIASKNPATLDASLFDSTGGSDNRKRKRNSEKSMDQKEAKEQELLLKGPGSFPLERLLAIFQCITSVMDSSHDVEHEYNDGFDSGLMSDVLLQLSSLCSANFISTGASCPLDGATRYRCTVGEDMALKVARSLKFPLSKYLYRR